MKDMKSTAFDSMIMNSSTIGQTRSYTSSDLIDRSQLASSYLPASKRSEKQKKNILETIKAIVRFRKAKILS